MFHILAKEEAVWCWSFSLAPSFLFHQSVVSTFINFSIIKSHCPLCQSHSNHFCCLPTLLPGLGLCPTLCAVVLSCWSSFRKCPPGVLCFCSLLFNKNAVYLHLVRCSKVFFFLNFILVVLPLHLHNYIRTNQRLVCCLYLDLNT